MDNDALLRRVKAILADIQLKAANGEVHSSQGADYAEGLFIEIGQLADKALVLINTEMYVPKKHGD